MRGLEAPVQFAPTPQPAPAIAGFSPDDYEPEAFDNECNYMKPPKNRSSAPTKCQKKAVFTDPAWLPMCSVHRPKAIIRAGRCKALINDNLGNGSRFCGRLFCWTPPYFEVCSLHQDKPSGPCYIFRLPPELRLEIFRYLIPPEPITSHLGTGFHARDYAKILLVNKDFYREAKDELYNNVPFTIEVRKEGITMCGKWLQRPQNEQGQATSTRPGGMFQCQTMNKQFLEGRERTEQHMWAESASFRNSFPFTRVKHCRVDILFERATVNTIGWDEEVETYDIRDYVRCVSDILNGCKLLSLRTRVALGTLGDIWDEQEAMDVARTLTEPLLCLRRVKTATFGDIFNDFDAGLPNYDEIFRGRRSWRQFPDTHLLISSEDGRISGYRKHFETTLRSHSMPPSNQRLRLAFSHFKILYADLVQKYQGISGNYPGRRSLLHRARKARENDNEDEFTAVLYDTAATFLGFQEQQKDTNIRALALNRQREFESLDRDMELHRLSTRLNKFLETCSNYRSGVISEFPANLDFPGKPKPDLLYLAASLDDTSRQECLMALPWEDQVRMDEERARIDHVVQQLNEQITQVLNGHQLHWVAHSLQLQHEAHPFLAPNRATPYVEQTNSAPGTEGHRLPTPPSSRGSKSTSGQIENELNDAVLALFDNAYSPRNDSIAGPSKENRPRVITISDSPESTADSPPQYESSPLPQTYTGKGKNKAIETIVIDD